MTDLPATDEELRALVELPELITTARRALFCLYTEVAASVANDVGAKVEAVFIQVPDLLKRLSQAEADNRKTEEYASQILSALSQAEGERDRQRTRLFAQRRVTGHDHSTACSVWGDDGQGGTAEGFAQPLPCNCGALENFQRDRALAAEALAQSHKDRADRLAGERDDLKTALHDLCMLKAQRDIGCVPAPTALQWEAAWREAEELVSS